jgi:multidrug resistance efflux pump
MLRILSLSFGVALVILLGFLLEAQSQTPTIPPPEPIKEYKIFAPGRLEGTTEEIELRPQLSGQIVSIPVEEGQVVRTGDILMQIDPQQYKHEVTLAESQVALARAEKERIENGARQHERDEAIALHASKKVELDQAQLSLVRIKKLRMESAVSQQELDEQIAKVRSLEALVTAAQAHADSLTAPARDDELSIAQAKIDAAASRLALAKVELDRTTLRALTPGQVMKINVAVGELARPESLQPSMILSDTSAFRVRAFVEELDAPRVQTGMTVSVEADGLPGRKFSGKVVKLSPRMSSKQIWNDDPAENYDTKAREIWIDLDQAEDLVVGLRVDVTITTK